MKTRNIFLISAFIVLIVDQLTKFLARQFAVSKTITNFFSLTYTENTGALFGLFKGNALAIAFLGLIAAGLLLYFYKEVENRRTPQIFYGLVIGGVIGNIIDRFVFRAVIDFLNFSFWPAFNIADMAAAAGVIGLLAYYLKKKIISS